MSYIQHLMFAIEPVSCDSCRRERGVLENAFCRNFVFGVVQNKSFTYTSTNRLQVFFFWKQRTKSSGICNTFHNKNKSHNNKGGQSNITWHFVTNGTSTTRLAITNNDMQQQKRRRHFMACIGPIGKRPVVGAHTHTHPFLQNPCCCWVKNIARRQRLRGSQSP